MTIIPIDVTQKVFRTGLLLQKHAPSIMFVGGIGGVITSTFLACKATLKLPDALTEMREELSMVINDTDEVDNRDVAYVYAKNVAHVARLYAPAVAIGVVSIGALTGSHVTLNRRNAGLTAAYAAVSEAYDKYRDRVKNEIGEDKESALYKGQSFSKSKDGSKEVTVIQEIDPNETSPYSRFFDEYSNNWQKNAELNRLFVQCQQNYANDLLMARGHLFLNEVYDMLGVERSSAGQVVGWVIGERGDNYVDFGIFTPRNSAFVNGWERSVLLDFNVDGVIYDKIGRLK